MFTELAEYLQNYIEDSIRILELSIRSSRLSVLVPDKKKLFLKKI